MINVEEGFLCFPNYKPCVNLNHSLAISACPAEDGCTPSGVQKPGDLKEAALFKIPSKGNNKV